MKRNNSSTILALILIMLLIGILILIFGQRGQIPTQKPASPNPLSVTTSLVTVTAKGFIPQTIKIAKGSQLKWINQDKKAHQIASDPYPSHSNFPQLFSPALLTNDSFVFKFDKAGTYTYQDYLNPLKFKANIIVE